MTHVSVVMSVYNSERFLRQAIESILSQTYRDFEFIIVNDGSTDGSLDIIEAYAKKDSRICLISRENKGLVASLNEGIAAARGIYIARMDADDIAKPERIAKQYAYMQANKLALCGSAAETIDEAGKKIGKLAYLPQKSTLRTYTLFHNPFIHPSVMFRKDVFEAAGGYRRFFAHIEDYELWTRIIFAHAADNIPEMLLEYRLHPGQVTKMHNIAMRLRGILVRALALWRFIF